MFLLREKAWKTDAGHIPALLGYLQGIVKCYGRSVATAFSFLVHKILLLPLVEASKDIQALPQAIRVV